MESHTAFHNLTGARFALKCHHIDTAFVDKSEALRMVKQSMLLSFRVQQGNAVADRQHLPFTLDLIQECITHVLKLTQPMDICCKMALFLGIGLVARKCEYILTRGTDHHLRVQDVEFVMRSPVDTNHVDFISAMGARGLLVENVVEVILVIRSAKNDFEGIGKMWR